MGILVTNQLYQIAKSCEHILEQALGNRMCRVILQSPCLYPLGAVIYCGENVPTLGSGCWFDGPNEVQPPLLKRLQWENGTQQHAISLRGLSHSLTNITL